MADWVEALGAGGCEDEAPGTGINRRLDSRPAFAVAAGSSHLGADPVALVVAMR